MEIPHQVTLMGYNMKDLSNNSLYDRVNKLLVSYEWSDCSFSVHGKKFKAHKLILGISSPVFEAMFYGPLSTNEVITITDIEPNIFQMLLNYIYTDKVDIHSIEESYDLMYVSRKYMLDYLTKICIAYIESHMSIDNVISVLNYPDHMQDNQLVSTALKLCCQHAGYLLTEHKSSMTSTCLQKILKCNEINISEKDLIKSVFEWTSYYCDQNEIKNNIQNRRDVLVKNGLFKLLRFYTLSLNELNEIIASNDNLLIKKEEEQMRQNLKSPDNVNNNILSITDEKLLTRRPLKLQWCLCHRSPLRSESPMIIDLTNYKIHTRVKSNKSTLINAFSVHSRMAPVISHCNYLTNMYHEQFTISIECEENNSIIKNIHYDKHVKYDNNIIIEFDEPILMKKDCWYKISFIWPQNNFYSYIYSVQSRDPCYNNGKIKIEFNDVYNVSNNGGSFLRGLKYCM